MKPAASMPMWLLLHSVQNENSPVVVARIAHEASVLALLLAGLDTSHHRFKFLKANELLSRPAIRLVPNRLFERKPEIPFSVGWR
jgi:hypothetical protein